MGNPAGITIDPSTIQPIQSSGVAPGVTIDPNSIQPIGGSQKPQPPSTWDKVKEGIRQSMVGQLAQSAFAPPQNAEEVGAKAGGGDVGLFAYRTAKNLINAHAAMQKAVGDSYQKAVENFRDAAIDYALSTDSDPIISGHKRDAIMHAVSGAANLAGAATGAPMQEGADIAEGSAAGQNLATPLTRGMVDLGTLALGAAAPKLVGTTAAEEAPEVATEGTQEAATATKGPGLVKQVIQGEKVAQAPAKQALARGAQASAEDAGVAASVPSGGVRTFMDKPIQAVAKAERGTYDALNKASGTDLKSLYDHAEEVQDALDDPTNLAQKNALQADLKTTQDSIARGEARAAQNGVDPGTLKKAEAMTQQRYAMQAVKQKLFNNESVVKGNSAFGTNEELNIDPAIRQAENLNKPSRFAPEGTPTRLQQALGQEGANKLLQGLYDAQRTGAKAVPIHTVAKWIGGILAGGLVAGGAAELVHVVNK